MIVSASSRTANLSVGLPVQTFNLSKNIKKDHIIVEKAVSAGTKTVTRKFISREEQFISKETADLQLFRYAINRMVSQLIITCRVDGEFPGSIAIYIQYADIGTVYKEISIKATDAERLLRKKVWDLFLKLNNRRGLIRNIKIGFSQLKQPGFQMDIFRENKETVN